MANGVITIPGNSSVHETVQRIERLLTERGIKLFALIDHSGEAESAGLHMPETKLLIFGNPKAGTPVMLAAPSTALDLPLKILVAENPAGGVSISYNSADFLQQRHGFPDELTPNLGAVAKIASEAAQ